MKTKRLVFCMTIIALIFACGKAYCQIYFDWWGSQKVDIAVVVRSAATIEPLPKASIRLTGLDNLYQGESVHSVPEEQITDESGSALFQPEFNARGGTFSGGWKLSGRLEISKDGYQAVHDSIVNYTGNFYYPMSVNRIEIEVYLHGPNGDAVAPLLPIGFSPYGSFYLFKGETFERDRLENGYDSIADAIAASGPMDEQLKQYFNEYKRRISIGQGLVWSGLILMGTSIPIPIIWHLIDPSKERNPWQVGLMVGMLAGGYLSFYLGNGFPGRPTELVDYYNKTNR